MIASGPSNKDGVPNALSPRASGKGTKPCGESRHDGRQPWAMMFCPKSHNVDALKESDEQIRCFCNHRGLSQNMKLNILDARWDLQLNCSGVSIGQDSKDTQRGRKGVLGVFLFPHGCCFFPQQFGKICVCFPSLFDSSLFS